MRLQNGTNHPDMECRTVCIMLKFRPNGINHRLTFGAYIRYFVLSPSTAICLGGKLQTDLDGPRSPLGEKP